MGTFHIRQAKKSDSKAIVNLINQLAEYEKLSHESIVTVDLINQNVFEKEYANVLIAEENNCIIGFALYFFNFSTFIGKPGLYLEDLFVEPLHRGKGYGKMLLAELAKIAIQKECGRMEWVVLNWNTPSIKFYKSLGAFPLDEWSIYRLTEEKIKALAESH